MSPVRHLIVGSGIAALSAAESILDADPHARVTLVSRESHPFYSRPGLPYHLSGEVPEARLAIRGRGELEGRGLVRLTASARSLDTVGHTVALDDGRGISYDRLLLAPGAESVPLGIPGAGLEGVVRLDGLDDTRALARRARRGRSAVVVGGGSTALEIVEAFALRGLRTHYVMRGEHYWARLLDPTESGVVEGRLEAEGVRLHRRTEIVRAVGDRRGRLRTVETDRGESLECDLLFAAIGVRPRIGVAKRAGLAVDRGILVDRFMATSAADVYAAGDAAETLDPDTGEGALDTLWASAAEQGRTAGINMAGGHREWDRQVPLNVTRLAGITTTIVGAVGTGARDPDLVTITRGQSERWVADRRARTLRVAGPGSHVRIVLGPNRIVGALVMGDQALARPLVDLIRHRVDTSALRAELQARPDAVDARVVAFHRRWEEGALDAAS